MARVSKKPIEQRISDPTLRQLTRQRCAGVNHLIATEAFSDRAAIAKAIGTSTSNLGNILNRGAIASTPALRLDALIEKHAADQVREESETYGEKTGGRGADVFQAFRLQLRDAEATTNRADLSIEKRIGQLRKRMEALITELDAIDPSGGAEPIKPPFERIRKFRR